MASKRGQISTSAFEGVVLGQILAVVLMSASGINLAQACALLFKGKEEFLEARPLRLPVQHL